MSSIKCQPDKYYGYSHSCISLKTENEIIDIIEFVRNMEECTQITNVRRIKTGQIEIGKPAHPTHVFFICRCVGTRVGISM